MDPKYLTIEMTMRRLSLSRSFVYDLIGAGLLSRVDLPAPPGRKGRRKLPRITIESIWRYESGGGVVRKRSSPYRPPRQPKTSMQFR